MIEARRPHLVVLVGIPGCGKSTYATRLAARCGRLRIVSPDLVREALYPGYELGRIPHLAIDHRRVFQQAYRETIDALAAEWDVVFDATSLTPRRRRKLLLLGRRAGALVIARYFPIPIREALRRNLHRARRVPAGIIVHMARILVPPTRDEGFDRIVRHRQRPGPGDKMRAAMG